MNEQMIEPCPFCGSDGQAHTHTECGFWIAGCSNPDCIAHQAAYDFVSRETAIAAWNTRAAHSVMAAKIAELEGALRLFIDDERFHVTMGGNPSAVEAAIAQAHAALAPYPERRSEVEQLPDPTVLGEVAFAVRAMLSKKRRELAKLEGKNDADEHLPSMRSRLERLEQGHKWLNSAREKSWASPPTSPAAGR